MKTFEAGPSHDLVEIMVDEVSHTGCASIVVEAESHQKVVLKQYKGTKLIDETVLQEGYPLRHGSGPLGVEGPVGEVGPVGEPGLSEAELEEERLKEEMKALAATVMNNSGIEGDSDKRSEALKELAVKAFEKPADPEAK